MLTYGISLVLNVVINTGMLELLHRQPPFTNLPYKYFIAFAVATGLCASFTFLGQKFWIFRSEVGPVPEADAG